MLARLENNHRRLVYRYDWKVLKNSSFASFGDTMLWTRAFDVAKHNVYVFRIFFRVGISSFVKRISYDFSYTVRFDTVFFPSILLRLFFTSKAGIVSPNLQLRCYVLALFSSLFRFHSPSPFSPFLYDPVLSVQYVIYVFKLYKWDISFSLRAIRDIKYIKNVDCLDFEDTF